MILLLLIHYGYLRRVGAKVLYLVFLKEQVREGRQAALVEGNLNRLVGSTEKKIRYGSTSIRKWYRQRRFPSNFSDYSVSMTAKILSVRVMATSAMCLETSVTAARGSRRNKARATSVVMGYTLTSLRTASSSSSPTMRYK